MSDDIEACRFDRRAGSGRQLTGDAQPAPRTLVEPGTDFQWFLDRHRLSKSKLEIGRDTENPGQDDSCPRHDFVESGCRQASMENPEGSPMKRAGDESGGDPSRYLAEVVNVESGPVSAAAGETPVVVVTANPVDQLRKGQIRAIRGVVAHRGRDISVEVVHERLRLGNTIPS